jgi:hypothetical protein
MKGSFVTPNVMKDPFITRPPTRRRRTAAEHDRLDVVSPQDLVDAA